MKETRFFRQAELLLKILPFFRREEQFVLKGGTAINFFLRDLPRLSVDIDLTYLPLNSREKALTEISEILQRIAIKLNNLQNVKIRFKFLKNVGDIVGFIVEQDDVSVKVEPNLVLRGVLYSPQMLNLADKAVELFETNLSILSSSRADLYGGKICAALDRQHPRDLFDVKILLENEGFTDEIRKAFIVYLISHSRPMVELLNPNFIDIKPVFENEFQYMTLAPVAFTELVQTRQTLVSLIYQELTENERRFILSIKNTEPQWDLIDLNNIKELPAVKWKLQNLMTMDRIKHREAVEKLRDYLQI